MIKKTAADEIAEAMAEALGIEKEAGPKEDFQKAKTLEEVDGLVKKYTGRFSMSPEDPAPYANAARSRIQKEK